GTVPGRTRRVDAVLAPCVLAPRPLVRSSRFHHRSPPVPPRTARPARSLRMIAQNTRSSTTSSSAIRDVEALIESAADVVAPQWPLATFAARSPWLGLEDRSFDDVARWYAALNGLTLYPDAAHLVVRAGEPEGMSLLSQRLGVWLAQKGYPVHDTLLE